MSNFLDYDGLLSVVTNIKSKFSVIIDEINGIKSDILDIKTSGVPASKLATPRYVFGQPFDGSLSIGTNLRIEINEARNYIMPDMVNDYAAGLHVQNKTSKDLYLCEGGGKVGIGTNSPEYALHISSSKMKLGSLVLEDHDGELYINGKPISTSTTEISIPSVSNPSTPETFEYGSVSTDNEITLTGLDSGTYTLKYIDINGDEIANATAITNITI